MFRRMGTLQRLIPWLRARRSGWSGETDRAFHDALFAAHDHNAFSPAYTGNITIRRFADLAEPFVKGCGYVIDVGCGLGEISCELARRFPATRFLGIDHSEAGVTGARRNAEQLRLENATFEAHDMERFTPDEDPDLVTMFDAFHHLVDPHRFVERMGRHTQRFLLIEPQGDWKGSWTRKLDFDWLAQDLEKIRAHLAYSIAEAPEPNAGNEPSAGVPPGAAREPETDPASGAAGEPVENRYSIEAFEKMFAGYGLRIRGTVSGLDTYPPGPTLDTPTRRQFGELAYQLYRSVDERLYETGFDVHAKHLVIHAVAGAGSRRREPRIELPASRAGSELRGPHDVQHLAYDGPREGPPGATFTARVSLRNRSFRVWSSNDPSHPDMVSYHWLDTNRRVVVEDGDRSPLPRGLAPGDEADVAIRVTAPGEPGDYILAIDMVKEGKCWFRDAGSPTLDIPYRVRR